MHCIHTLYMIVQPFFFLSGGSLARTASRRCTHSAMSGRSLAAGAQHCFTKAVSSIGSFLFHLPATHASQPAWSRIEL